MSRSNGSDPARPPRDRKGLCGCWITVNTHPHLDLREGPLHGRPGHAIHTDTHHAWCNLCAPNAFRLWS